MYHYAAPALQGPKYEDLFQRKFGRNNPQEYFSRLNSKVNISEESHKYESVQNNVRKYYGNGSQTQKALEYQKYRFESELVRNNTSVQLGIKTKANIAEAMQKHFYGLGGYRQIDCSVGVNGIDGLFVRDRKGEFKVKVVDTKSDGAGLGRLSDDTWQMTREWTLRKIDEKIAQLQGKKSLAADETELVNLLKRVRECVDKNCNVKYQVLHVSVAKNDLGHGCIRFQTCDVIQNKDPTIKPTLRAAGDPMLVDMALPDSELSPSMVKYRNHYYAEFHSVLDEFVKDKAFKGSGLTFAKNRRIIVKLQKEFENGKITSMTELISFLKRNLKDPELAQKVAARCGNMPDEIVLPESTAQVRAQYVGVGVASLVAGSLAFLSDYIEYGTVSSQGIKSGVLAAGVGGVMASGTLGALKVADVFERAESLKTRPSPRSRSATRGPGLYNGKTIEHVGKSGSKRAVQRMVKSKNGFGSRLTRAAKGEGVSTGKYASNLNKVFVGAYLALEAKNQYDLFGAYSRMEISQTDYSVKASLGAAGAAGMFGGKIGAAIGTAVAGPPGTAVGAAIGAVAGYVVTIGAATANVVYDAVGRRRIREIKKMERQILLEKDISAANAYREKMVKQLTEQANAKLQRARSVLGSK